MTARSGPAPGSPPAARRRDLEAVVAIFLAALAVRLVYLYLLRRTPLWDQPSPDPSYYIAWGRRIAAGDWLSGREVFEQSPLYAYILGAVFRIAGDGLLAPRLVQAIVGSLTCVLVLLIGRRAFGRAAGVAGGLLAALYAPAVFYDGMMMKTTWAVFLTAAMTAALLASEGSRRRPLFAAGLLLGLAALVRDNLVLLAPLLAAWLAADVRLRGALERGRAREAAARVAWLAAGIACAILPVTARNAAVAGEAVLLTAGGGEVLYIGNNPEADGMYAPPPFVRAASVVEHEDFRQEAARRLGRPVTRREASNYWIGEALRWIAAHPLDWLLLEGRKARIFLNAYELPDNQNFDHHRVLVPALAALPTWPVLLACGAAGIVLTRRSWRDILPLYLIALGYAATVLVFFNFARFRMPLTPVLLVFAGAAIAGLPGLLRPPAGERRPWGALAAGAGAALIALAPPSLDPLHLGQSDAQLAALYARAGRLGEALAASQRGLEKLEALYRDAGGRLDEAGHGVAPRGDPGRPALGVSYYGVLMDAYVARAEIERQRGSLPERLRWLSRAAAAAPDAGTGYDVLVAYAEALLDSGRPADAIRPLEWARSADPRPFRPALLYAQALHRSGRLREAAAVVDEALAVDQPLGPLDLADANFGLGLIHRDLGDLARMRFHFREALAKNPAHPRAAWMRKLLEEPGASRPR